MSFASRIQEDEEGKGHGNNTRFDALADEIGCTSNNQTLEFPSLKSKRIVSNNHSELLLHTYITV